MFVALKKIICYNKHHFITHKIYWEKRGDFMKQKNEKGITLVALVVTIIILLILASVSINLTLGDNGIIIKAKEAKRKSQ